VRADILGTWVAVGVLGVYLALFSLYYRKRQGRNSGVKDRAAEIFSDLAERVEGRYERVEQRRSTLYAYADLGRITGRTMDLTYKIGCYQPAFEDVGGRLHFTVRPAEPGQVFDVPSTEGRWSSLTKKPHDTVHALYGRRYAARARADLHPKLVRLATMTFEVHVQPGYVLAYAPAEVYDWPTRLDNEAAARWIQAMLALLATFPTRAE
jgi:hypothetical protein